MFSLANRFDSLRNNKSQAALAASLAAFSSELPIPRLVCTLFFFTCYDSTTFFSLTCLHMANKIALLKMLPIPNFLNGSIKSPGTALLQDWMTSTSTQNFQDSWIVYVSRYLH